ncbi:CDH23 [Acanthosepion pharaonis]|uniref:CDH23 n=1 Tax=Acanthosepion pharaonis TaxID=158019 RepID=A0A812CZA5_ACAPH|nr:CDH23 [Sepia pharaonis]
MSVGVTRDTDFGTTIFELQYEVDDPDIGNNSVHAFQQIGAIRISESLRSMMTRDPVSNRTRQPFIVSSNGSVITNMFFQPNMHGSFVLPILVTDGVHSSDTANLTINFVSDSQRLKVIFRRPPLEVQKIKEKFLERLQNITGLNIIIDRIKTHQDSEGNPEVKTTDMFIHGLKMNSNQVLEARELLRNQFPSDVFRFMHSSTDHSLSGDLVASVNACQLLSFTFRKSLLLFLYSRMEDPRLTVPDIFVNIHFLRILLRSISIV